MRPSSGLAVAAVAVLALSSCASTSTPEQMTVAAYGFPENQVVAAIYAEVLQNAGIQVERKFDYNSQDVLNEDFANGEVDLVPDYLGPVTDFVNRTVHGEDAEPVATGNAEETLANLKELTEPYAVRIGELAPGGDSLQFAVTADYAAQNSLAKLSDLAALNGQLILGGPKACPTMQVCQLGLEQTYGLQFASFTPLDAGGPKTFDALTAGTISLGMVLATDPAVEKHGLVVLDDDQHLQTAGNLTPLFSEDSASEEVLALIGEANSKLTTEELRTMNTRVAVEGFPVDWVAQRWAADQGLIPETAVAATPTPTPPPTPTPTPTPSPTPAPAPAPAAPPPAPSSGYSRNMGEPSANAQSRNWAALAQCESGGDPNIVSSNGLYFGLYQFSVPTWQSMGGSGNAAQASSDEQTYRAQILYDRAGPGQWPVCGSRL